MAMMLQVKVFCVVTLCSVMIGYEHFRGLMLLPSSLHPEDGGNKLLNDVFSCYEFIYNSYFLCQLNLLVPIEFVYKIRSYLRTRPK
jgi:hypothetical protein